MMTPWTDWAARGLASLAGVVVLVELARALPLAGNLKHLAAAGRKSLKVVSSRQISDHWKEKVLPRYAGGILGDSLLNLLYLLILAGGFSLAFCLVGMWLLGGWSGAAGELLAPSTQIIACVLGVAYALGRAKLSRPKAEQAQASDYDLGSKLLHHLALDSNLVRKAAFDLDCSLSQRRDAPPPAGPPVYVAGLARAGTTILLEALYASRGFATLTYRDMPFVIAPGLWKSLSAGSRQSARLKERAHKDRLLVNYDSPESFEEVFWLTFDRKGYVRDDRLEPHKPPREVLLNYRRYVANVIAKDGKGRPLRYLAKNNNNLLRIAGLKRAFPQAVILVPFRNPQDHAKSLMAQHQRFLALHREDPFSLRYMNWLGHHEFGANLKPFAFGDEALPAGPAEREDFSYWVRYWRCVYAFLLEQHADQVVLFDYDRLCEQPAVVLEELAPVLGVERARLEPFLAKIQPSTRHQHPPVDPAVLAAARQVHAKLRQRALGA